MTPSGPRIGADAQHVFLWKPAGVPVFPPHDDREGDCLLRRFAPYADPGPWPEGFEGGLAHRLDTATSGLVVAARSPAGLAALRAQFRAGALRKFYVLRSPGEVDFEAQTVEVELAHHPRRRDRMVARRGPRTAHRGRWYPAWTRFSCLGGAYWQAEIRTGVMHQIRIHAAHVGLALEGDALYGGPPGAFLLHHARIVGPGWRSPFVPPDASLPGHAETPCDTCGAAALDIAGGRWCAACGRFDATPP